MYTERWSPPVQPIPTVRDARWASMKRASHGARKRMAVARERMRAARLREAPHQALVVGVEEDHAHVVAARALLVDDLGKAPQALAAPRVGADGDLGLVACHGVVHQRRDEIR